jgi:hypothetical protein
MATAELTIIESTLQNTEGVSKETKTTLIHAFQGFFIQTEEWKEKAKGLVITDPSQKAEMKQARDARLALKNIRVQTEHTRKELKEESLRTGQTIDAIAKIITNQIVPIEKHLEEQEKFVERMEAQRKQELADNRAEQLARYEVLTAGYDLGGMSEDAFTQLLENSRIGYEAKQEQLRKEEEARIEAEKQEQERQRKLQIGNQRMRQMMQYGYSHDGDLSEMTDEEFNSFIEEKKAAFEEAERTRKENEEAARIEREKLEADRKAAEAEAARIQAERDEQIKKEREEADRLRRELEAKTEAERKAKEEEAARVEAELSMGDKSKMQSLLSDLEALKTKYTFKSKKHNDILKSVSELIDKTIAYTSSKI